LFAVICVLDSFKGTIAFSQNHTNINNLRDYIRQSYIFFRIEWLFSDEFLGNDIRVVPKKMR